MESRKTAEQGNGHTCVLTARQAKRAGPDLEAGPEASAERSEGTMEARMGRDAAGGLMRSTTARPAMLLGRGRTDFKVEQQTQFRPRFGGPDKIPDKNFKCPVL